LDNGPSSNLDWIQQSISTEQGAQYLVLIDALSRVEIGTMDDFELHWNNQVFSAVSTDAMRGESWQTFGGLVTGTGGSDALRIIETADGNNGAGPLIDNVRAYRYEPETPSVDEHLPAQTPVTHILVNMLDGTSYTNLRLAEDGGGRFALDAESGLITTTRSLDYDSDPASYRLTVAVDTEGGTHLQYLSVVLNETNQGPTAVALVNQVSSISEAADTDSRTRVADIEITDDGAGTNVVSLTGSDAGQFEVVGNSLYLRADRSLDYETQSSYSVTVNVIDPAVGSPVTTSMTLTISDANDAPTGVTLTNAITSLPDDVDVSSRVRIADIQVTDDALGNNRLSLSGADVDHFELVGSSLYLRAGTELDSETQSTYSVNISAVDPSTGGNPITTTMNLEIAPPGSTNMIVVPYDP
ncbi:MAG: cadherin repeat domain-containing protein, partial [Actinomycetota bacterium]|nr:cadherin repeat domain-containing protein [Actinomycetota bacterium]